MRSVFVYVYVYRAPDQIQLQRIQKKKSPEDYARAILTRYRRKENNTLIITDVYVYVYVFV